MHRSGKLVLLGMLLVGVGLAAFAVWHRYASTRQALAFWGPHAAGLISTSAGAELLVLARDAKSPSVGGPIEHAGRQLSIRERHDLSDVRGLAHMRAALVEDSSFDWTGSRKCESRWTHALRFFDGDAEAIVLIDLNCQTTASADTTATASIAPIADGLWKIIGELENKPPHKVQQP